MKAHVAIEPETGILTAVELTPANTADAAVGVELLDGERPGLQVLADSTYGSGEALAALAHAGHSRAVKPHPLLTAVPGGIDRDDFVVDTAAGTSTCPAGHTVRLTQARRAVFGALCRACPLRGRCTRRKGGRVLHLHLFDAELVESRRAWRDGDFADDYRRWRLMVERSIAWLVAKGNRRCRFRGVQANRLGLSPRAAAINLRRLVNLGLTRRRGKWELQLA